MIPLFLPHEGSFLLSMILDGEMRLQRVGTVLGRIQGSSELVSNSGLWIPKRADSKCP